MTKQKIAVLIDWYLPGTKAGGPVRSVFSLVNLLKNDFDFYIITTNFDLGSSTPYNDIEANTLFFKEDVHYYYFSAANLSSANMLTLVNQINPDLVYLNSFWSFQFSISLVNLKNKQAFKAPLLLAPRGMLGKGALSLKSFKKTLFLLAAKYLSWYKHVPFHASQHQEELDIKSKFRSAKIVVAPNINSCVPVKNVSAKTKNHLKMFFLSRISEVKNLHFALEVLKEIPNNYTVEYDIFGNKEDVVYWQRCESIIKELPSNITVTYKQQLQFNQVQDHIKNYNCLFMPTLNENFGHSIVESLLCGCPAIISDQTPWNDLEQNRAGFALPLDSKHAFVDAIVHYAELSEEEFAKNSLDVSVYIDKKINLTKITNQYKTLFNECIKN